MFIIRKFTETDLEDVISLWEICDLTRPWNSPEIDIFRKVAQKDELFLVAVKDNELIATLMGGYDGHRGWLNYLASSTCSTQWHCYSANTATRKAFNCPWLPKASTSYS